MPKHYTLFGLLLAALPSLTAQAQTDFRPGYIVRTTGDTLRGQLNYHDIRASQRQCEFRTAETAPATTYLPTTLQAYGLPAEGKHYRALVPPGAGTEPAFMEVLVSGPANLYMLRDADRADHYYVATKTFPLTELIHRRVLVNDGQLWQEQNLYRNTLAQALPGCPAAQAKLQNLLFTSRALAQPVEAYNACVAPAAAKALSVKPANRQRARFGVVLGLKRSSMTFRAVTGGISYTSTGGVVLTSTSEVAPDPDTGPLGGLSLNLPLTALSRKLSLEVELLYESQRYSQTQRYANGFEQRFDFNMPSLRLPLLVRYTLPTGRVRPLLEAGPTLSYLLSVKATSTITPVGSPSVTSSFFESNARRFQEGIGGGIGGQFSYWQGRQATLLARYERDTGWVEGDMLNSWTNHFYLLLTLGLSK